MKPRSSSSETARIKRALDTSVKETKYSFYDTVTEILFSSRRARFLSQGKHRLHNVLHNKIAGNKGRARVAYRSTNRTNLQSDQYFCHMHTTWQQRKSSSSHCREKLKAYKHTNYVVSHKNFYFYVPCQKKWIDNYGDFFWGFMAPPSPYFLFSLPVLLPAWHTGLYSWVREFNLLWVTINSGKKESWESQV